MHVINVCTVIVIFVIHLNEDQCIELPVLPHNGRPRMLRGPAEQKHFCIKERECTPSDEKVCGFDQVIPFIAVFGDLCTMYRANCKGVGTFSQIDMVVCDTRIAYDKAHPNETFEYIHLNVTTHTIPRTRTPKIGYITRAKVKLV